MEHGAESMELSAWRISWPFSYALCALRRIKEVRMSEEVRIYTTPT